MNTEDYDDDRVYVMDTNWWRENVRLGPEQPLQFETLPSSDPDKYTMRVSAPMPPIYIKSSRAHQWDKLE